MKVFTATLALVALILIVSPAVALGDTGQWVSAGSMSTPRTNQTATLQSDSLEFLLNNQVGNFTPGSNPTQDKVWFTLDAN